MAKAPQHKLGQVIGEVFEVACRKPLDAVARKHGLYLDRKGPRPARGGMSKVIWKDAYGNKHELDYVLEADGTDERHGRPRAFVEIAWRRYTKHSRNKAGEIYAALVPLFERWRAEHPFMGVIVAGDWTDATLALLRSQHFVVLHIPFESIVSAFRKVSVNASYDETTDDDSVAREITKWEELSMKRRERVENELRSLHADDFKAFTDKLDRTLSRTIVEVRVLPLHGEPRAVKDVASALAFIESYEERRAPATFVRYEVEVHYSNGDEVRGRFEAKNDARRFLSSLA